MILKSKSTGNKRKPPTLVEIGEESSCFLYPRFGKVWHKGRNDSSGLLHRKDGPAIMVISSYDPFRVIEEDWYYEGLLHRYDGPAVRYLLINTGAWYVNGNSVEEQRYCNWLLDNGMDINNLTEEDKSLISIVWERDRNANRRSSIY